QVQAWASMKSFVAKDGSGDPPSPGRNGERHFHGEQRSNETHSSTTDPEAKLAKKGKGKEAKLAYTGQRHDGEPQRLRRRGGTASSVGYGRARNRERHDRALFAGCQAHHRGGRTRASIRLTSCPTCATSMLHRTWRKTRPIASPPSMVALSAIVATRSASRSASGVEEPFGWGKTIGGLARPMLRSVKKLDFKFTLTMAAYDLIKLPRLIGSNRLNDSRLPKQAMAAHSKLVDNAKPGYDATWVIFSAACQGFARHQLRRATLVGQSALQPHLRKGAP